MFSRVVGRRVLSAGVRRTAAPALAPLRRFGGDAHHDPLDESLMTDYLERPYVLEKVMTYMKQFDRVDASKVTPTATFKELGFDSLDTVEVVIGIEEEFQLTMADDIADSLESIDAVVDYLVTHPKAQ